MDRALKTPLRDACENQDRYHGIELASIETILQTYCKALSGKEVEFLPVASSNFSTCHNAWWSQLAKGDLPDSHINVCLPAMFTQYPDYSDNFAWYKAAATCQVGHFEFGSFDFKFDTKAAFSPDLGLELKTTTSANMPPIGRFLSLFEDHLLAARIFVAVENVRVNYLVKHYYPGIRHSYIRMQKDAFLSLQQMPMLTMRRTFCEMLEGLEFGEVAFVRFDALVEPLEMAWHILEKLCSPQATVEDSAEATIRIYRIATRLPRNLRLLSTDCDMSPESEPDFSELEEQEYAGNFNADMMKLNLEAKNTPGRTLSAPLTAEDLRKLSGQKLGINDIMRAQSLPSTGLSAADLPRGVNAYQFSQSKYQQVDHCRPKDASASVMPDEGERLFCYDEWDFRSGRYLPQWCTIREKTLDEGASDFYERTLEGQKSLAAEIRRQFERLPAELLHKVKNLEDGDEYDLDQLIDEIVDKRAGQTPSGKIYTKKKKIQRDVVVAFLLDMSGSTADLIDKNCSSTYYDVSIKYDFMKSVMQPRRRIIDLEKESIVLLINAIEALGDSYGIYGFSGHGRSRVQFLVIKDINESFSKKIKRRIDHIAPVHGTRMGPAIRHTITKLDACGSALKLLFLVSDGYPQDSMYGYDDDDKEYAIHDTKMALIEASRKNITPFCLTVDSSGTDYLRTMCQDIGYEVLDDIETLPRRLPMLYKKLSV